MKKNHTRIHCADGWNFSLLSKTQTKCNGTRKLTGEMSWQFNGGGMWNVLSVRHQKILIRLKIWPMCCVYFSRNAAISKLTNQPKIKKQFAPVSCPLEIIVFEIVKNFSKKLFRWCRCSNYYCLLQSLNLFYDIVHELLLGN